MRRKREEWPSSCVSFGRFRMRPLWLFISVLSCVYTVLPTYPPSPVPPWSLNSMRVLQIECMESAKGHAVYYCTIAPSRYGSMVWWRWCDEDDTIVRQRDGDGAKTRWHDDAMTIERWRWSYMLYRAIVIASSYHRYRVISKSHTIDFFAHALFEENGDRITL